MLTVLTPTGARPEAFAACVALMRGQTHPGPVRWVIVDDGPEPMPVPAIAGWEIVHVRPWPLWAPGQNTQARNLAAGLDRVTDRVVVVEDDDWYAPWWLARCAEWLEADELVGEAPSLYRHRNGAERDMGNTGHASLCSTALKGAAIAEMKRICAEGGTGIDIRLWRRGGRLYPPTPRGVVGIKGWPGRPGIGVGHRMRAA